MSVNSRLKATKIIGQRKAFYKQRIPEFSRARKETVDVDILVDILDVDILLGMVTEKSCNLSE